MCKSLRSISSVITLDQYRELEGQQDNIVSLVTRPWKGQLRNHVLIPSRDERFCSSPKCSDQPVSPPTSYLEGSGVFTKAKAYHSLPSCAWLKYGAESLSDASFSTASYIPFISWNLKFYYWVHNSPPPVPMTFIVRIFNSAVVQRVRSFSVAALNCMRVFDNKHLYLMNQR